MSNFRLSLPSAPRKRQPSISSLHYARSGGRASIEDRRSSLGFTALRSPGPGGERRGGSAAGSLPDTPLSVTTPGEDDANASEAHAHTAAWAAEQGRWNSEREEQQPEPDRLPAPRAREEHVGLLAPPSPTTTSPLSPADGRAGRNSIHSIHSLHSIHSHHGRARVQFADEACVEVFEVDDIPEVFERPEGKEMGFMLVSFAVLVTLTTAAVLTTIFDWVL